jgi:hypothetical protein
MASRTPKQRGGSPTKQRTNINDKSQIEQSNINGPEYVVLDKDLVRGLSEKEVEIEHLKTTVVALQEKVEVM